MPDALQHFAANPNRPADQPLSLRQSATSASSSAEIHSPQGSFATVLRPIVNLFTISISRSRSDKQQSGQPTGKKFSCQRRLQGKLTLSGAEFQSAVWYGNRTRDIQSVNLVLYL